MLITLVASCPSYHISRKLWRIPDNSMNWGYSVGLYSRVFAPFKSSSETFS